MKKFISIILITIITFSQLAGIVYAQNDAIITIENKTIFQGENAEIYLNLSNCDEVKSILLYDFTFDASALSLEKVELLVSGTSISDCSQSNAETVFAFNENTNCEGNLLKLTFKASASSVGTKPISCSAVIKKIVNGTETTIENTVKNGSVTIAERPKKTIEGINLSDKTFTYDGTEKSIAVAGTLPQGATVSYENNKGINVGQYNTKATVKADGYYDLVLNATMTINPKELKVSGLVAQNKVYDGTTEAVLSGGTLSGKVSGDEVSAIIPATGTFADANVGKNKVVSIGTIELVGEDADNYKLTQPSTIKANITEAPIGIKADDITVVKGTELPELTYTITDGKLFGDDTITGALSTKANTDKVGTYEITKGNISAGSNYKLTFTKGAVTVVDRTPQNIEVSAITAKIYGDAGFKVEVTPDAESGLTEITYSSSNPDVAEIDAEGNVTIKNAGKTNITVSQAGDETYAPFNKTQELVVNKREITITADSKFKKVNADDPELTYTVTGELVAGDEITGEIAREEGEDIGTYDITLGTLAINDNYNITFNGAIFEIVDKTPQNIVVYGIDEKTYGDAAFAISVTTDETANLTEFTFESSNTDVAEVDAAGNVTIKAAGEADITVKQAGNDDYAAFEETQKLVVNKKGITVNAIDFENKTATLEGVLDADTAVVLDFGKIKIEIGEDVDEITSNVTATNFVLTGEKAENYIVITESVGTTIAKENVITVSATAEKGIVEGIGAYVKGSEITLIADANGGYRFKGWYNGETLVSEDAEYTFVADEDVELVAEFKRVSSGNYSGGGSGSAVASYKVNFVTNGAGSIASQTVKKDGVAKMPEVPVKEGFVFGGWYTDKELTAEFDFATKITKSITLFAKWTDVKNMIVLTIGEKKAAVFGEEKENDVAPKLVNSRTMLPARFVAESLGAEVIWTAEEMNKVVIKKDDVEIVIYIGSDKAYVNGKEVTLDSPAFLENDRTYTPIRFISEELGADVDWIEETEQVIITKK